MPKLRSTIRKNQKREQLKAPGIENLRCILGADQFSQAWNPSPLKTAGATQADMAQVGVKVVIVPVEGRFQEARLMDMKSRSDLIRLGHGQQRSGIAFRPPLSCAAITRKPPRPLV